MSVPLDNLYHWVESLLPVPAVLYVFHPHGSKKISDFNWFKDYDKKNNPQLAKTPGVICYDQEPLDWNLYDCPQDYLNEGPWILKLSPEFITARNTFFADFNLKSIVYCHSSILHDNVVLIHSEKNSVDLKQYESNGFVGVHYWAHAVIARDWYRFAQIDYRLNFSTQTKHKFLVYCRDWSHRREYRLKFLEMLVQNNLHHSSQTSIMHTNSEDVHFSQHQFVNPAFKLINPEIITEIPVNTFSSNSSADYDYLDFINTEISVVLETVFDDSRIHLTEKTLRPIACGHPFILAAGPGALEYMRSYGFKTFAPWIDESYDTESNSLKRLEKIIQVMKQIQTLQGQELEDFSQAIKSVAEFNKKYFFSDEFFNVLKTELKSNLDSAVQKVKKSQGKNYLNFLKLLKQYNVCDQISQRQEKTLLLRQLRQSCPTDLPNPQEDPVA